MSTLSQDELNIKVSISLEDALKKLDSIEKAIQGTKKNTEELSSANKKASESLKIFGKSVTDINQGFQLAKSTIGGVIGVIKNVALGINKAIEEGGKIDSLAQGFETLQNSIGNDSVKLLENLRTATKGLVSDFDLMLATNKAVLLGLPTEGFDEAAAAAIKLGRAMGVDAKQAVDNFTTGVGRGSALILDNLGIMIDTEQAYRKFAEANNIVGRELDENETKLAFQEEAYRTVLESAKNIADVNYNAADALKIFKVELENQRTSFLQSIANSEELKNIIVEISNVFANFDSSILVDNINSIAKVIGENLPAAFQIIKIHYDTAVKPTFDLMIGTIGLAIKGWVELKKVMDEFTFGRVTKNTEEFRESLERLPQALNKINQGLKTVSTTKDLENLKEQLNVATKAVYSSKDATKIYGETLEKLRTKITSVDEATLKQASTNKQVIETTKTSTKELKEQAEIAKKLEDALFKANNNGLSPFEKKLKELIKANPDKTFKDLTEEVRKLGEEAIKAGAEVGSIASAIEKIGQEKPSSGGFFDSLFKIPDSSIGEGIGNKIGEDIATGLSNSIGEALSLALNGGNSDDLEKTIGGLGQSVGSILGTYFGPIGTAIGGILGEEIAVNISKIGQDTNSTVKGITTWIDAVFFGIGSVIQLGFDSLFGGTKDKDTLARKSLEKFFDRLIKDARKKGLELQSFLNDDFSLIAGKDAFDPFVNAAGEATNAVNEKFKELTPEFQQIFSDLGIAFEQFFSEVDIASGQTGQLLGVNFQSLNDLQLLLQSSGITVEQFQEKLDEAYLSGKIGAGEFLSSSREIQNVYAQGIPDAVGATETAMKNFTEGGLKSGRVAMDALGDIAVEMAEKGITSFEEMEKEMLALGYSAEDVKKFFAALKAAGINDVEGLKNVTVEQTAQIVKALEDMGFGFKEVSDDIRGLKKELDEIKSKEIDIKVNFRTNVNDLSEDEKNALNTSGTNTGQGQG